MRMILDNGDGSRWVKIEIQAEATEETLLSGTAIAVYFRLDERRAGEGHSMPAYYALRMASSTDQRTLVTGRIREAGPEGPVMGGANADIMFVGNGNRDPFPQYEAQIAALGAKLGIGLDRSAYPYAAPSGPVIGPGSDLEEDAEVAPAPRM